MPNKIGKYELLRKLGEGATSQVYLGYDPFAQREVAIKLIMPEALKDQERGRVYRHLLVNEASLAGRLNHPHIVQIYDAVVDEAQSYIVMEYVEGGTLEQYTSTDRLLPLERLVELIFKCTRALDYAHRLGITHRDIKPANILLAAGGNSNSGGDIKISDFGAAMLSDDEQTRTQVMGVGSPAYMSPEQVEEQPLNHQTDIFSLGVVMYQLLTGRLPFQASSNYGMIFQIVNHTPPPPSTFRSGIPAHIDAIVAKALEKRRENRYATWDEFSHDLAQSFRNRQQVMQTNVRREVPESERFETLRALSFFKEFSDVEIWEVVRFSRWEDVPADTMLMKDGEPGDFFCFLMYGEAHVTKKGRTLSVLSPGECFGEMALIGGENKLRSADVVCRTLSRIMTIREDALQHASDACRMHFYEGFLQVLTSRLNAANARLSSL